MLKKGELHRNTESRFRIMVNERSNINHAMASSSAVAPYKFGAALTKRANDRKTPLQLFTYANLFLNNK